MCVHSSYLFRIFFLADFCLTKSLDKFCTSHPDKILRWRKETY